MVVKNEETEKNCCFYVSDYNLEMILIQYINKKIDEDVSISTEKKLRESVEILMSKINMNDENKQKILNLGWDGEEKIKDNSNVIIIGSNKYIEDKNREMSSLNAISVLDCYNFEEEKDNINDIVKKYKNTLNTFGKNNFWKFLA